MVICGMELAGSEARLAIIDGRCDSFNHMAVNPGRITLADDENADEVKAFRDSIYAFLRENVVSLICIKKRNKRGEYAGGSIGFKLEGIIQLFPDCPIRLISPQAMAAAKKRFNPVQPNSLLKYQEVAFLVAFTGLPKR